MHGVPFPVAHPYEVWYAPGDHLPLRIGQPLARAEALDLVDIAATALPTYGIHQGQVLVVWNAAELTELRAVRCPSIPAEVSDRPSRRDTPGHLWSLARLALEDVSQRASLAEPTEAAPPEWIDRLHKVLRDIASPEDQRRYRLDSRDRVTMADLQRRVTAVLRHIDRLVAASTPRPSDPDEWRRLAH